MVPVPSNHTHPCLDDHLCGHAHPATPTRSRPLNHARRYDLLIRARLQQLKVHLQPVQQRSNMCGNVGNLLMLGGPSLSPLCQMKCLDESSHLDELLRAVLPPETETGQEASSTGRPPWSGSRGEPRFCSKFRLVPMMKTQSIFGSAAAANQTWAQRGRKDSLEVKGHGGGEAKASPLDRQTVGTTSWLPGLTDGTSAVT